MCKDQVTTNRNVAALSLHYWTVTGLMQTRRDWLRILCLSHFISILFTVIYWFVTNIFFTVFMRIPGYFMKAFLILFLFNAQQGNKLLILLAEALYHVKENMLITLYVTYNSKDKIWPLQKLLEKQLCVCAASLCLRLCFLRCRVGAQA